MFQVVLYIPVAAMHVGFRWQFVIFLASARDASELLFVSEIFLEILY